MVVKYPQAPSMGAPVESMQADSPALRPRLAAPRQRNTKPLTYITLLGQLAATSLVTANRQPEPEPPPRLGENPREYPHDADPAAPPSRRARSGAAPGVRYPGGLAVILTPVREGHNRSRSKIAPPYWEKGSSNRHTGTPSRVHYMNLPRMPLVPFGPNE